MLIYFLAFLTRFQTSAAPDDVLNHFKLLHMKKNVIVLELNDESKEGDEAAFLKCNQCGKDLGGDNKCSHFGSSADDPQNCSVSMNPERQANSLNIHNSNRFSIIPGMRQEIR